MGSRCKSARAGRGPVRSFRRGGAILALLALPLAGCDEGVGREFREAAMGSIEQGVQLIAEGIITGLFTVAEPDEDTSGAGAAESG